MVNATWKTRLSHTGNRLNWLQYAYLIVLYRLWSLTQIDTTAVMLQAPFIKFSLTFKNRKTAN